MKERVPATKILCTLGPSTDPPGVVAAMIRAGMDAARINFSHGGAEVQLPRLQAVRAAEIETGRPIAVLADLPGPKIRLGRFPQGPARLADGAALTLMFGDGPCDAERLTVDYPDLARSVIPGANIFLADGFVHLQVQQIVGEEVRCRVVRGGGISDRKGVNLPGVPLHFSAPTPEDLIHAVEAVRMGCDFIALSFVQGADDILRLKHYLREHAAPLPIVAKLERPEAILHLEEILQAADLVMVARGDLGVEVGPAKVPGLQKKILARAQALGQPAIVATQMLESMTNAPLPTRAEASDVANAILDGADVVMLSGETATGYQPVRVVEMMRDIAKEIEPSVAMQLHGSPAAEPADAAEAVVSGAMAMINELHPVAIVAFTSSGLTARLLAKRRPPAPIVTLTPDQQIRRRCTLLYGCVPVAIDPLSSLDEMQAVTDRALLENHLACAGDLVLITAGLPLGTGSRTNLIHAHRVGTI